MRTDCPALRPRFHVLTAAEECLERALTLSRAPNSPSPWESRAGPAEASLLRATARHVQQAREPVGSVAR